MIYVYMRGRLGNQLFQYAFARVLQKYNPEQQICYLFNDVYSQGEIKDGWENSLKYFNTVDVVESENSKIKLGIIAKLIMKLYWKNYPHTQSIEDKHRYQMKWIKYMEKVGLYYLDLGYYPFPKKCKKNIIVSGNFESEKYFSEIKEQLMQEITPRTALKGKNLELMNLILEKNSVCISVRRGDFVDDSDNSKLLNVCTKHYFVNAINRVKELVEYPVLFFFSDDIAWAKENLKFDVESYFEDGTDPVWEKLRLMYSCKHFIISNSTFSWWAQYLGKNPEKIVIAPSKWYNSEYVPDIIQREWEFVEVD